MAEIWKSVVNYPNYMVSNLGRIKSLGNGSTRREKFLKNQKDRCGYSYIGLNKKNKRKKFSIHRLVAEAFIPNPNNLPEVNHKDENKTNNFVYVNEDGSVDLDKSNLEWCDKQYNANYGTRIKRINSKIKKPVIQMNEKGEIIRLFEGLRECGRILNIDPHIIKKVIKGELSHTHHYIFKYKI